MAKKPEKPRKSQLDIVPIAEEAPKASKPRARKPAAPADDSTTGTPAPKKAAKPRKTKVKVQSASGEEVEIPVPVGAPFTHSGDDPIGDVSDGEGHSAGPDELEPESEPQAEMAAHRADTADAAIDGTLEDQHPPAEIEAGSAETEPAHEPRPAAGPARLERLQKILSQAGIASRRHAEELITEGRVQVNGQVVTLLGAKADPVRDHIRVDNKLISGAERHRYYMLNKPKGYVTTVSDPEGRPTVMHFFEKSRERLYPVGRLDYQSEGLLLVTNDGELANQLTRAASGVEKTYLVKVAGEPTEEQIDQLRSGVAIDRDQPGSGKVHTAPAEIRQVRRGDNPWFEVVLIEGRNRELRKMFSAIGHFVEKIRRVGYGPLVLDLEPGKFRELLPEELAALRLAAEGKWKPRRPKASKMLPKETGHSPEQRRFKAREGRPFRESSGRSENRDWKPREQRFGQRGAKPAFGDRGGKPAFGRREDRPQGDRPRGGKPAFGARADRPQGDRPQGDRPRFVKPGDGPRGGRPAFGARADRPRGPKPAFGDRGSKPAFGSREDRPQGDRPRGGKPAFGSREDRPQGDRPRGGKPAFGARADRPRGDRPQGDRPRFVKPGDGPRGGRPAFGARADRPRSPKPAYGDRGSKPAFGRPQADRPQNRPQGRPRFDREDGEFRPRQQSPGRNFSFRPQQRDDDRGFGDRARPESRGRADKPFFKRDGFEPAEEPRKRFDRPAGKSGFSKPRGGGFKPRGEESSARPSGRFDRSGGSRSQGPARGRRQDSEQDSAPFRGKSKPRFGSQGRPSGSGSRPAFGGKPAGKSGGKSSGFKRSGPPRQGGKRPGNRPGGGKRG